MKVFYIFVSFYCLASVTVASRYKKENPKYLPKANECGKDQIQQPPIFRSRNLMIFGGDEAKHENYPFSARVGVTRYKRGVENTYEKYTDWVCGGTLINSWYVVTAAHCHSVNQGRQITRVNLGGDGLFAQDFAIKVKDVRVHERYKRCLTTVQNDIALIRLQRAAEMSAQVASACLPLHRNRVAKQLRIRNLGHGLVGEKITVVGSGYSGYANEYSLEFNKESAFKKLNALEVSRNHKSIEKTCLLLLDVRSTQV